MPYLLVLSIYMQMIFLSILLFEPVKLTNVLVKLYWIKIWAPVYKQSLPSVLNPKLRLQMTYQEFIA